MMGEETDVLLGFLACPQVPHGDRMLLLSGELDRTQDELDRNDRSVRLAQFGFDRLIGPAEKLEPRGFVREVLAEIDADCFRVAYVSKDRKAVVDGRDDVAVANDE